MPMMQSVLLVGTGLNNVLRIQISFSLFLGEVFVSYLYHSIHIFPVLLARFFLISFLRVISALFWTRRALMYSSTETADVIVPNAPFFLCTNYSDVCAALHAHPVSPIRECAV